jgi:hypothetical protein
VSSTNVIWAPGADEKYANVSLAPALSETDRSLLTRLLGPAAGVSLKSMLQAVTEGGWDLDKSPDFLAVRTGSGVTAEFSGGGNVTSWTNGGTGTTVYYFGGGKSPDAFKGVAISYGPDATAGDRANEKMVAMGFLTQHLSDYQLPGGGWNRPLIDAKL